MTRFPIKIVPQISEFFFATIKYFKPYYNVKLCCKINVQYYGNTIIIDWVRCWWKPNNYQFLHNLLAGRRACNYCRSTCECGEEPNCSSVSLFGRLPTSEDKGCPRNKLYYYLLTFNVGHRSRGGHPHLHCIHTVWLYNLIHSLSSIILLHCCLQ